jgi:hypothetical protein
MAETYARHIYVNTVLCVISSFRHQMDEIWGIPQPKVLIVSEQTIGRICKGQEIQWSEFVEPGRRE